MKFKTTQLLVFGLAISLFSIGCSSETDLPIENKVAVSTIADETTLQNSEQMKFQKETSLLVGRLLLNNEVRDEVLTRMKEVSDDGELVSFGYLLGKRKGIRKAESDKTASYAFRKSNLFAEALKNELATNAALYPIIGAFMLNKKSITVTSRIAEEGDPFTDQNLQIYSPYNEVNETPEATYDTFYTSVERADGAPTNSGYFFEISTQSLTIIPSMDNDLIDTNPSFITLVIDSEDLVGGVSTTTELFASGTPALNLGVATLLTTNVNHSNIPDKDILNARIPMIRINGNNWMGFGATRQKLKLFRASSSWYNSLLDGAVGISGQPYEIGGGFTTKRKNVRKKNWLTFDQLFDDNWKQSENSEQLVIFSNHYFAQSKRPVVNVKYGLIVNNVLRIAEGTSYATGAKDIQMECYSSEFRGHTELFRNDVLSTIVGNGSTGKTQNDAGVDYNVKSTGIVDYYFKYLYTQL